MTTQYGAPLTGAQMKLLRAAGLKGSDGVQTVTWGGVWHGCQIGGGIGLPDDAEFRLPADHIAYTLLNAGWLDGRNVALWFGGDEAPDDLGSNVTLLRSGKEGGPYRWDHFGDETDIIAYTRKAEGMTTHADRVLADAKRAAKRMGGELGQNELWGEAAKADEKTVTIAKMTEAEAIERFQGCTYFQVLEHFNLIKEPTRLERFWLSQPNGGAHVTNDVKAWVLAALYFEREK